jgi:hypothetical protein
MTEIPHMLRNPTHHYRVHQLKVRTLRKRRYHLDALFLIQVYLGSNCPLLEIAGLRVPAQYISEVLCLMSSQVETVPLLDALQLPTLFAGTLT